MGAYAIDLDFYRDTIWPDDDAMVREYADEYAPTGGAFVTVPEGIGGGAPLVTVWAPTRDALAASVLAYCGGDARHADDMMNDAYALEGAPTRDLVIALRYPHRA